MIRKSGISAIPPLFKDMILKPIPNSWPNSSHEWKTSSIFECWYSAGAAQPPQPPQPQVLEGH